MILLGFVRYIAKGCPKNNPKYAGRAFPQPNLFLHHVVCCNDENKCSTVNLNNECHTATTYPKADTLCKKLGMRLCRRKELDDNCCGKTDCQRDSAWVWILKGITSSKFNLFKTRMKSNL